jgi:hypothetical protein
MICIIFSDKSICIKDRRVGKKASQHSWSTSIKLIAVIPGITGMFHEHHRVIY